MKSFIFVFLLGMHSAAAVTHSLKYFYTGSSQVPNFPEFVAVGLVDEVQMVHYDSNAKKAVAKQDWMAKNTDPQYWERETGNFMGFQQTFKANIEIAKQRFNQTGGVHIHQYMYGCEWDDQTQQVTGYRQHGYDGEDFVVWDVKTNTWIAPKQQAEITKHKWNNDKAELEYRKSYLNEICPEWLKKYVTYGRSSLMRTELPSVSFLQKTPSSPVSCHATGFYPNGAELFWRKDGEEIHEGVDKREVLPNNDGTFQMSTDLKLSSVPTEDWMKYECVFQLLGEEEDLATQLEKTKIKTNTANFNITIIAVVVTAIVLAVIAMVGFILYKKKNAKRPPSPVLNPEVQEQMLPKV